MIKKTLIILALILTVVKSQAQEIAEVSLYRPLFNYDSAELNGKLVYCGNDGNEFGIIFTDGTPAGTTSLLIPEISGDYIGPFKEYNNKVYFQANGIDGNELWVTDGTIVGTHIVKDIHTTGDAYSDEFIVLNGFLYFVADDNINGKELWRTDGTEIGTVLVKDIYPGSDGSTPQFLTLFNNEIYFNAYTTLGFELWKSDGTTIGTVLVKEINTISNYGSYPRDFHEHQGKLYFTANNGYEGIELYVTDGTEAGTEIVADIASGNVSSNPSSFFSVGNNLFFGASLVSGERELFLYNSQSGNINMLDVTQFGAYGPLAVGNLGDIVFIKAPRNSVSSTMYTFNLSTGIIEELFDLEIEDGGYKMCYTINNNLFFGANDGTNGLEMWRTDGSEAGTLKVESAISVNASPLAGVNYFIPFNNAIYFNGTYSSNGEVLCKVYYPTLDVNEFEGDELNIYPNPANDIVNIESKENQSIEIVDVIGNIVWKQNIAQGISSIDVSSFNEGIYFVRNKNSSSSTKFIISK